MTKGKLTGAAKAFIEFLTSDKGQAIVSDLDFIPAS
jgi:ABC-type Fe3+ transport system substrate-binding protein